MERLRAVLGEEARRLGLAGTFGQAVANHVFSQRTEEHFGSRPCGVILAAEPKSFRNLSQAAPQRVSEVLYFQYLHRPSEVVAHAPEHHQEVLGRIYGQFDVAPTFVRPEIPPAKGEVHVRYLPEEKWALIRVRRVGADTAEEIRQLRRKFWEHSRTDALYLDLPLNQAGVAVLCREAEAAGFFFCAIGPCFGEDGDVLRLQWLNVPLDTKLLQIENAFARELLAYIDRERHRVGNVGPG
jgi:hypothetical protein